MTNQVVDFYDFWEGSEDGYICVKGNFIICGQVTKIFFTILVVVSVVVDFVIEDFLSFCLSLCRLLLLFYDTFSMVGFVF